MSISTSNAVEEIATAEILNGVPHGIALLDSSLSIVRMNRFLEALTGYSEEDARGIPADFILRSNLHGRGELFHQVMASGEVISQEGDIITCHRKKVPIYFTISPLHDRHEAIVGLIVVLEDLSALQHCERSAIKADGTGKILGHSPKMQEVFELLSVLARTDASLLITGETGTGKDMIAELIHLRSRRARHPFIKLNCGALPEALLESELFGHVRGAFTGAVKDKPGMFRLAHHGTIFLTEIGDLPLSLQVKLLTVLDDREFYPVGASKKVKVDVRVVAATHRSLQEQVKAGKFREDLFYRLNVLRMHLPPLRDRDGDIRLLLDHFLREFDAQLDKSIEGFNAKSLDILLTYAFPGNVRELRNIVEFAANICPGKRIKPEHLPLYLTRAAASQGSLPSVTGIRPGREGESAAPRPPVQHVSRTGGGWSEIEKEMIIEAMKKTAGNRSAAAKRLGWGRTTLWRKLKNYDIA